MKRLLALIMAMALIFAFSACSDEKKAEESGGAGTSEPTSLSVEEIMEKSIEVTKEVKSVRMKMDMDMNMSVEGEAAKADVTAEMDYDIENELAYMNMSMTVDAGDENLEENMEMYVEYEDDSMTMYTNLMGTWIKQTMSVANMSDMGMGIGMGLDGTDSLVKYLENLENCTVEKAGEKYKIVGNFGDLMTEEITSSIMENMGSVEIPEEFMDILFECFEDAEYVMYVDAETFYPTNFEMDLSDAMREFMEKLLEEMGEDIELGEIEIKANCEYYDYNAPVNIVIPEEAKAAEEQILR